jgi:tRNA(Ile)-lysidine synthase
MLAARFNPAIVDVLAREAELARETWAWLEAAFEKGDGSHFPARRQLENAGGSDRKMTPVPFFLDVPALEAAPLPLRRLAVWRAMSEAAEGRPVSFGHVQAALRLLDVNRGRVDAPGHRVERLGSRLVLTCRQPRLPRSVFQYKLSIPGEVQLLEAGCSLVAEPGMAPVEGDPSRSGRGPLAMVRGDLCPGPLAVRNRRPGDRFRPVGAGGRKKLQDYFVDRKVAAAARDRVPLVVDQTDRIIWVAGYGIDEAFRVTDGSQSVLFLRLKQA